MQSPDFTTFFAASAGAGAALVGLLFVAVSVNPGRNAGPNAPPERQAVAASAYTALINAFFISLVSLIGADSLGGVAIVVGSVSLIATVRLVGDLFPPHVSRWIYARHVGFLAIGVIVYGLQIVYGWQYLSHGASADYAYNIAYLVIAAYGMGLTRAWQLLGAKRRSVFFSWFSPLNDLDEATAAPAVPAAASKRIESDEGNAATGKPEDPRPA
jgi:hypothetical protein